MGHSKAKYYVPQYYIHFGYYAKLHGFHDNSLGNFKDLGVPTKNTPISPATHAKTLNLVTN